MTANEFFKMLPAVVFFCVASWPRRLVTLKIARVERQRANDAAAIL
jgi:hypothetical protein